MYPNLEIDHIYKIVKSEEDAIRSFNSLGFDKIPSADHVGQGTSAKFVIFKQNYLEHIYLRNREEALGNPIKFHERVDEWENGTGSQYGFGFRGTLSEEEKKDFVLYEPKYGNYVIYKHKSYFENKNTPSIFVMSIPGAGLKDYYPINNNKCDVSNITDDEKLNLFRKITLKTSFFDPIQIGNLEIVSSTKESVVINKTLIF